MFFFNIINNFFMVTIEYGCMIKKGGQVDTAVLYSSFEVCHCNGFVIF